MCVWFPHCARLRITSSCIILVNKQIFLLMHEVVKSLKTIFTRTMRSLQHLGCAWESDVVFCHFPFTGSCDLGTK